MNSNRYTILARLFPAALSAVPFFVLGHYYLTPILAGFIENIMAFRWAGDFTITAAAIFLLMQINRWISKIIFEDKMFLIGTKLPTTDYLLHMSSYFSPDYLKKIHEKIAKDFNINLASATAELVDESVARKKISEAVDLIRLRVGSGKLVGQHNIEYGFARNLAGGSVIGLVVSLTSLMVFSFYHFHPVAATLSGIVGVLYGIYLSFARRLIVYLGENYARVLIQEYMSQ